jgi:hypothetical protein
MMKRNDTFRKTTRRFDLPQRHVLERHWVWPLGANALEFDPAALNGFVTSRLHVVDWRVVVTWWQLVLQDAVQRIGAAFDWLEPKIDSNSRPKRACSGYL